MSKDFASIIASFRERCVQSLQEAEPNSDEYYAYSQMIPVFDQKLEALPGARVGAIASSLKGLPSRLSRAKARAIVREWANNFIHDTDLGSFFP